jgi:3-deoxy-D-manno-octulosonic-acid transferase
LAQATAFSAGLLSHLKAHPPESSPDIILVDSLGQLRALYALSEVSFVGGSLVRQGGHNPLEPAAWGKPVLFGPDMRDFSTMSGDLLSAGAAVRVQDTEALCRAVDRFLADPRESQEMGKRAWAFFKAQGGAVERILNLAAGYLQE